MKHIIWTTLGAALLLANVGLAGAQPAHSTRAHAKKGAVNGKEGAASSKEGVASSAPTAVPSSVPPELGVSGPSAPFPDVPKDHWAFAAVEAVRKAGIIVGYPAGTGTTGR